ncbi:MAG: hypothetical protein KF833_13260 [Verrucomicrobiae bacterium]|nr:hypothetical protein [Verrucomicrobiae bacterium]
MGVSISAWDHANGRFVAAGTGGQVLRSQPLAYLGDPRPDPLGGVRVRFEGEAGREYQVLGSFDLIQWSPVATVTPTLPIQDLILPAEATAGGYLFYRLGDGP